MWQALAAVQTQVMQRLLAPEDVSIDLLHQHLYTQARIGPSGGIRHVFCKRRRAH